MDDVKAGNSASCIFFAVLLFLSLWAPYAHTPVTLCASTLEFEPSNRCANEGLGFCWRYTLLKGECRWLGPFAIVKSNRVRR